MQKQKPVVVAVRDACKGKTGDEKVECGFEVLAGKIDGNTSAIKEVDKRVSRVEEDVKGMRQDVVEIKEWQGKADTRFGNIDASITHLDNKIDDVETRLTGHVTSVQERLDRIHDDVLEAIGKKKKR